MSSNKGRDIWLVRYELTAVRFVRTFETLEEARDYVKGEILKIRLIDVGAGVYLAGGIWHIEKIRLGRYEDGS